MAKYDYDLTVIGGGSGGLVAAQLGTALGAKVALIDKERLGGDCLHYGCVPSKTLIHAAKIAHTARRVQELGVEPQDIKVDMGKVADRISGVIERIGEEEQSFVVGVDVRFGHFQFTSAHEFTVNDKPFSSRQFIICTGSGPKVPKLPGLTETGYFTNEQIFDLRHLPSSLIVIGCGPIGVEMSQAFARLGTQVTTLQGPNRVLPKEEPEMSDCIAEVLKADGVNLVLGARAQRVYKNEAGHKVVEVLQNGETKSYEADEILVALGRVPVTGGMNLEAAGVLYTAEGIKVDDTLRTTAKNIWAAGDVIGGYQFTHVAAYQAGTATQNALLPTTKKVDYRVVPWVTFSEPEAARVGLTEAEARAAYKDIKTVVTPYAKIDRAQAAGETTGFIKLVLDNKGEQILGAHIVGAAAGETLGTIALAMQHKLKIADIVATIFAYPTFATGLQSTAFETYLHSSTIELASKIVPKLLGLKG